MAAKARVFHHCLGDQSGLIIRICFPSFLQDLQEVGQEAELFVQYNGPWVVQLTPLLRLVALLYHWLYSHFTRRSEDMDMIQLEQS